MKKVILLIITLVFGVSLNVWAVPMFGDSTTGSTEGIGSFVGDFEYSFESATQAQIIVQLTNNSPSNNGGYLTAFAFNNPEDLITGSTFGTTLSSFSLIGAPTFDNSISVRPFGDFDEGASTSNSWLGGGAPSTGIAVGDSETFTFNLTGSNLNELSEADFLNTLSYDAASGQSYWFAARFRGFDDGGSDKVPANNPIPEPATMLLFGTGLASLASFRLRKKKK